MKNGFSLIETLVAISILLIVITGPLAHSVITARSSTFSSEQEIAFFLAQEGAELAQKARDEQMISHFDSLSSGFDSSGTNHSPWSVFTNTAAGAPYRNCYSSVSPQGCGLTISNGVSGALNTPINCSVATCQLYLNTTANNLRSRYTYTSTGAAGTPFTRRIIFERDNTYPDEVKVTSRVTWRTGSLRAEQQVQVETRLFNVYGTP